MPFAAQDRALGCLGKDDRRRDGTGGSHSAVSCSAWVGRQLNQVTVVLAGQQVDAPIRVPAAVSPVGLHDPALGLRTGPAGRAGGNPVAGQPEVSHWQRADRLALRGPHNGGHAGRPPDALAVRGGHLLHVELVRDVWRV